MEIYFTTKGPMRWDAVSVAMYGVPGLAGEIIRANPDVVIDIFTPAGVQLKVPVIETTAAIVPQETLPPWKR